MRRRRLLLLALGCLAVLAVLTLFLLAPDSRRGQSVTLADGTKITLLKITSGTNHQYFDGNALQRVGHQLLPRRWAAKTGGAPVDFYTPNPTHCFWVQCVSSSNSGNPPNAGFSGSSAITDDAGGYYRLQRSVCARRQLDTVEVIILPVPPTGSRKLRLTFTLFQNGSQPARDDFIDMDNPAYLPQPKWKAEKFPIHVVSGDLELIVYEVRPALPAVYSPVNGPVPAPYPTISRLRYDLRNRAATNTFVALKQWEIINERGGRMMAQGHSPAMNHFGVGDMFDGVLSTNSLWRFRFKFDVHHFDGFAPSNQFIEVILRPEGVPTSF